jgi:hypothetical protein
MIGVEAGFYLQDLNEAADEKSGSDEKNKRQGDFTDDKQAAETIVSDSAGRTATPFLKKFSKRLASCRERWCEAEEQAGEERHSQSKAQHAKVYRDFLNTRQIAGAGSNEEVEQHGGEGQAECAA